MYFFCYLNMTLFVCCAHFYLSGVGGDTGDGGDWWWLVMLMWQRGDKDWEQCLLVPSNADKSGGANIWEADLGGDENFKIESHPICFMSPDSSSCEKQMFNQRGKKWKAQYNRGDKSKANALRQTLH